VCDVVADDQQIDVASSAIGLLGDRSEDECDADPVRQRFESPAKWLDQSDRLDDDSVKLIEQRRLPRRLP
jgi:hypothetical protein